MSEIKLKPCPFCGGEGDIVKIDNGSCCYIQCQKCRRLTFNYNSPEGAAEAWNKAWDEIAAKQTKLELKPCPFCGGKAEVIGSGKYSDYLAKCSSCGATSEYKSTPEEAAEAWNKRF